MSHIVGDFRPGGFTKRNFVILGIAAVVLFAGGAFKGKLAEAVSKVGTFFSSEEATAALPSPTAAVPKDYTLLALGNERMKRYKFALTGANKWCGWLILDEQAADFRFDTDISVPVNIMRYPSGARVAIPAGKYMPGLWQYVVKERGEKQFFSLEAGSDCALTVTVSR